jgi:ribosomal protein S13
MMMFQEDVNKGDQTKAAKENPAEKYSKVNTDIVDDLQMKFVSGNWAGVGKTLGEEFLNAISIENFMGRYRYLDEEATKIRNSLGLGVEKSQQLSNMVADNIARFAELGYTAGDVGDTFSKVIGAYGANIAFTNEDLLTLKATSEVTNTEIGLLATSFKNVGVGVGQVGDRMVEVTEIARNAGVSVAAVAKGVVTNLDKMNIYNFEGGTKGLAKMSAQATRLGFEDRKSTRLNSSHQHL